MTINQIFKNRINLADIALGYLLLLTYILMPQPVSGGDSANFAAQGAELSRIVYVRQIRGGTGASEIFIMNSDGTNQTLLTTVAMLRSAPSISKDGSKVVFSQFVSTGENIYVINTDGTNLTPLTNYQSKLMTSPNWSFDGSKITFAGNIDINNSTLASYEIYSMNANGTGVTRLTTNSVEDNYPFWSPDGSKILYSHSEGNLSGLYVMNANGSNPLRILTGTNRNSEWSPNGAKIAFDRIDGFDLVYTINSDGNALTLIAGGTTLTRDKQPTWSPDGARIAWSTQNSDINSSLQISTMNPDGTGKTPLTNNQMYDHTNPSWGAAAPAAPRTPFDFDGDGKADVSVFRPSDGYWYRLNSSNNQFVPVSFGISTDKPIPADYDGDGKTDVAVFRSGNWYLLRSQLGFTSVQFGLGSDIPIPADYDGDGKADVAVFRPSNGDWYRLNSSNNQFVAIHFGANGDKPVPADYDGDGKTDLAVFRNGDWYLLRSQLGFTGFPFGLSGDKPVPADYDGDGKADVAVYRPSDGKWYLNRSQLGFTAIAFGVATDLPTPADYDGDGKTDVAIFRNGIWYSQRTVQGFNAIDFGTTGDIPTPSAFGQ